MKSIKEVNRSLIGFGAKKVRLEKASEDENQFSIEVLSDLTNLLVKVKGDSLSSLFEGVKTLEEVEFGTSEWGEIFSAEKMFFGCLNLREIKGLDTCVFPYMEDMRRMFADCPKLEEVRMTKFESKPYSTEKMFSGSSALKLVDLSGIYISEMDDERVDLGLRSAPEVQVICRKEDFEILKDSLEKKEEGSLEELVNELNKVIIRGTIETMLKEELMNRMGINKTPEELLAEKIKADSGN